MIILELLIIANVLTLAGNAFIGWRSYRQLIRIQYLEEQKNLKEERNLELLRLEKRFRYTPEIMTAQVLS
jgi:hypothetical protein